jgi:hypothetical protein
MDADKILRLLPADPIPVSAPPPARQGGKEKNKKFALNQPRADQSHAQEAPKTPAGDSTHKIDIVI